MGYHRAHGLLRAKAHTSPAHGLTKAHGPAGPMASTGPENVYANFSSRKLLVYGCMGRPFAYKTGRPTHSMPREKLIFQLGPNPSTYKGNRHYKTWGWRELIEENWRMHVVALMGGSTGGKAFLKFNSISVVSPHPFLGCPRVSYHLEISFAQPVA